MKLAPPPAGNGGEAPPEFIAFPRNEVTKRSALH